LTTCPFCTLPAERVAWHSPLALATPDAFPVTPGHTLLIPRRHVPTFFDTTPDEQSALLSALSAVKLSLDASHHPDGYNVAFNAGAAAGQTVMHAHIHVIPRYAGDVPDPRGGVRGVIPGRQKYGA